MTDLINLRQQYNILQLNWLNFSHLHTVKEGSARDRKSNLSLFSLLVDGVVLVVVLVAAIPLIVSTRPCHPPPPPTCGGLELQHAGVLSVLYFPRSAQCAGTPILGQSLSRPAVVMIMMYKPVLGGTLGITSIKVTFHKIKT